jgi:hypothetical protein
MNESGAIRMTTGDVVETLHTLANIVTVRGHYPEGHPAIARADAAVAARFNELLVRSHELVLALIEGELVIDERPMPGLGKQLAPLLDAMTRHEIECLVFQRGILPTECGLLGRTLRLGATASPAQLRSELQAGLSHVLLRFAALKRSDGTGRAGEGGEALSPLVDDLLGTVTRAIEREELIDVKAVRAVATRVFGACHVQSFSLQQRAFARGVVDEAVHATNVGLMT